MLVAAIATLLTPVGSEASPYLLITLRIIVGMAQASEIFSNLLCDTIDISVDFKFLWHD